MFENLLIPIEQFSFYKDKAIQAELSYIQVDKEFTVFRVHKNLLWRWGNYIFHADNQEFTFEKFSVEGFSNWKKARDHALECYKQVYPHKTISSKVRQSISNDYDLVCDLHNYSCDATCHKINSHWMLCQSFYSTLPLEFHTITALHTQPTRQKFLVEMHKCFSDNLDKLYYSNSSEYKQVRKHLNETKNYILPEHFFWLMFVKPEIDLQQIFN